MKTSIMLLLLLLLLLILLLPLVVAVERLRGVVLGWIFLYVFNIVWLKPERLRRKLRRQGIRGPRPSLIFGNVLEMKRIQAAAKASDVVGEFVANDYTSTLFPYFEQWRKEYGPVYTYSTGNKQHLYVNSPELVKEMKQSTSLDLGKVSYLTKRLEPLLGNGILRSNGRVWAHQRKIIAPEFYLDKVKGMVGLMVESTQPLVRKWEACIELAEGTGEEAEISVDEDLRSVSADVISRACFGSSYSKGKQIFSKLRILQKAISNHALLFGLPTIWRQGKTKTLEREIESLIWEAVEERQQANLGRSPQPETDLMQSLLDGAMNDNFVGKHYSSKRFVVDNCKNIYFAGHESTAAAASWCLMLLALHPDWQARVREEVAGLVCRLDGAPLDADSLPKMKTITMVIQEALRLYPPAAFVSREALEEMEIGSLTVPKGVCVWTLIPTLHRDSEIWGDDANEFKPERFANGVSGACTFRHGYLPFGLGPRLCLGRNFAMVQLKVVLAVIVSKFRFSLSLKYRHSPAYRMIVEPGHGVQIIIRRSN